MRLLRLLRSQEMRYGVWLSRFCLALIFLLNGFGLIDQTRATQELAAHGVPARLLPMLIIGGRILQVIAGTALLFGVKERLAALALVAFLVPATLVAHDFWAYHGPEFQGQLVNFTKNMAMVGGLLFVVFHGPDGRHGEA